MPEHSTPQRPPSKPTESLCADCQALPAKHFLPEGRYLCAPCWGELRALRAMVVTETAQRRQRAARR